MNSEKIKNKLKNIAKLEQKHGVIGISLNPGDDVLAEDVLDYACEIIKDSSQIIKNKSKLRKV